MFGRIAPRYDLLNRLLSLSLDRSWRRRAARELNAAEGERILDLCCGTGDLAIEIARGGRAGLVVGCDFSHPMLVRAGSKLRRRKPGARWALAEADGLRLPFAPETFEGAGVAFGVRNFQDLDLGLREILRVLRPGGRLVVLEFSRPRSGAFARLYGVYLNRILPRLGDGVSGNRGPYGYLARTIGGFPDAASLAGRIREAGFAAVGWLPLTGGIVAVHTARKAGAAASAAGRRGAATASR